MHWVLVVINAASVVAEGDIIAWNVEVWRGFGILQLLFSTPMCQAKLHHGKRSHRALCLCPALEFLALCFSFSTALPHFAVWKTKMACVRASDRFPVAPFADLVAWDPLDLKLFFSSFKGDGWSSMFQAVDVLFICASVTMTQWRGLLLESNVYQLKHLVLSVRANESSTGVLAHSKGPPEKQMGLRRWEGPAHRINRFYRFKWNLFLHPWSFPFCFSQSRRFN